MDFDIEQLEAITGGDREFEREILAEFLNCAPSDVESIGRAIAAGDSEALGRRAHALKGSSATIGAKALADVAKDLEIVGRASRAAEAQAVFGRLQYAFAETRAWIQERLAKAA